MMKISLLANYATWIAAIISCIILMCKPVRTLIISPFSKMRQRMRRKKELEETFISNAKQTEKLIISVEEIKERVKETEKDNLCTLRSMITSIYIDYADADEIPLYVKENVSQLYERYTAKGGNSYIHDCYDDLMSKRVKL